MRIGYFLSSEEYTPEELVEQARLPRRRVRGAVDQRPLPPVERRAGPEPVGLVDDRRDLAGVRPAVTTAVTCPTTRIHPAIIAQAAATSPVLLERAVHPRASAPVRRSTSTSSATAGRRSTYGWSCSRRPCGHPRPVDRRFVTTTGATTRSTTPASTPSGRAAADLRVGLRAQGGRTGGADRRRLHRAPTRRRPVGRFQKASGGEPAPGRRQGGVRPRRRTRAWTRPPPVAERGAARGARPGPAHPRALRAGHGAGHHGVDPASVVAGNDPEEHLPRSRSTRMPGTTSSTSRTWARTIGDDRVLRRPRYCAAPDPDGRSAHRLPGSLGS